ncbi:MAG: ParB/RepB/Spo0J family partition protein, partial [Pseudomonadota bacterium]
MNDKTRRAELDAAILGMRDQRQESGTRRRRSVGVVPISDQVRAVAQATGQAYDELKAEFERAVQEGRMVAEIDPGQIVDSAYRDRDDRAFQDDSFLRLQTSIAKRGQLTPVALRQQSRDPDRYEVVFGHRRVRACRALGIKAKAVVIEADDRELVAGMLIENAVREDLSPIEKARHYRQLLDAKLYSRAELAAVLEVTPQQISNLASLTELPDYVLDLLGDVRELAINPGRDLLAALREMSGKIPTSLADAVREETGDANQKARFLTRSLRSTPNVRTPDNDKGVVIRDAHGRKY